MPPPAEGFAARLVLGPALRTQPDRRLVALVREGYELAFEEIVRRYGKPLARYAAAIAGSRGEDVTQDAFSKALLALRRDGAEIELRPWLFRIVRNTALNELRDNPPAPEVLAEAITGGRNPAEEFERREELTDLMRRLQSLPEPQRAAIVMRELEGLGHEEIATSLGLSGGGARQAIYRARRALRDGAGMLLPLPLLKTLLAWASNAPVDAAAGAAGLGGAAGVGVALKATTATVLVVGALGAGVAVDHSHHGGQPEAAKAQSVVAEHSSGAPSAATRPGSPAAGAAAGLAGRDGRHDGPGRGRGQGSQAGSGPDRNDPQSGSHEAGGGHSEGRNNQSDVDGHRGGPRSTNGEDHGDSGSSGQGGSGGSGGRQSGRDSGGSSGSGGGSSEDGGTGESSGTGGNDSASSGGDSDSNSSPDSSEDGGGSGDESPLEEPVSGDSGDSHDGDGFSQQTEPQTQEEP